MPQRQLPIFPVGTTLITPEIAADCRDGKVIYVNGHLPVFQHAEKDLASFRLFTSQLVDNGTASQADIARAFHVPSVTVAALSAGEDPDQLSFLHAVRVVRRKMAAFGAIPPSGPKRVP